MAGDLYVMGGFVSAEDRELVDRIVGESTTPFFRIGPMREFVSERIGREIPRNAILASARRLGYRVNGFNFAVQDKKGVPLG